ncbi:MAG: pilus assembly protein PilM [Pirellulaceae bacterium]
MVQARKGWIGVDFGAAAIKLAQLERDAGGVRLSASAVVQRENRPAAAEGDPLWSFREVQAALALDPRFHGRASACVLSPSKSGVRTLSVPPGSDSERRAMISNQLLDALGAELAECEFDFWTTSCDGESDDGCGAVFVARRDATETAQHLARAGLSCEVLDGAPLALARAAQWRVAPGELAAVVDWGYTQSLLTVVLDGRPVFVRSLRDCGYQRLLSAVTSQLGLSSHDVQQLLSLYGVASIISPGNEQAAEMARLLSQLVAEPLLAMEQQLVRTLNHLQLHRQSLAPTRMLLCGGGATIHHIDALFSLRLDLPVEVWRLSPGVAETPSPRGVEPMLAAAAALSALAWNP